MACSHCPASPETIVPHAASLGKDKNSKFEVWFLPKALSLSQHPKVAKSELEAL